MLWKQIRETFFDILSPEREHLLRILLTLLLLSAWGVMFFA